MKVFFKRLFDLLVSLILFILLSPVMLVITLLVRIKLGKPVLFSQERPGLHGRLFRLYKFRTMRDLRGADGGTQAVSVMEFRQQGVHAADLALVMRV